MTISKIYSIRSGLKPASMALLCMALVVVFHGCKGSELIERFKKSEDPYQNSAYPAALEEWTRDARSYTGFELKFIVSATFKSLRFRNAYTDEYCRIYKLAGKDKEALLKDQKNAATAYNDFVMGVYVPDKSWNDLNKKKSIWKIYLAIGENKRIEPLEIRKIKKADALCRHFYPYITPWKSVYFVRFPVNLKKGDNALIDKKGTSVKLIITSVLGSAEMVWGNI